MTSSRPSLVEVLEQRAARDAVDVEPHLAGDVLERRQRMRRRERRRRDQETRRDAVGIGPEGHVRDVEEPARPQVAGIQLQHALEHADRACRSLAARVHALALDRQQAGIAVVAEDAVLLLAPAHQRGRLQHQQVDLGEDGLDGAQRRDLLQQIVDQRDAVGVAPGEEQFLRQHRPRLEQVRALGRAGDRGGDGLGPALVDVEPEIARRDGGRAGRQQRGHLARAGARLDAAPAPSASRRRRTTLAATCPRRQAHRLSP